MRRPCEICSVGKGGSSAPCDCHVLIEGRVVALCKAHASAVRRGKIDTLDALRRAFPEASGARSLIARRGTGNRRIFPARPEGRRKSDGRRWDDELRD